MFDVLIAQQLLFFTPTFAQKKASTVSPFVSTSLAFFDALAYSRLTTQSARTDFYIGLGRILRRWNDHQKCAASHQQNWLEILHHFHVGRKKSVAIFAVKRYWNLRLKGTMWNCFPYRVFPLFICISGSTLRWLANISRPTNYTTM